MERDHILQGRRSCPGHPDLGLITFFPPAIFCACATASGTVNFELVDAGTILKQVTIIYPVISAKLHQPVSFELDLRIDFAYLVNLNFSLLCPFVYINQLFNVHFGKALFASITYQKPSLKTKIRKISWGSMPPDLLEITYCMCDTQSQLA